MQAFRHKIKYKENSLIIFAKTIDNKENSLYNDYSKENSLQSF